MVISALIYVSNDLRTDEKADLASCNEALVRRNRILYHIHRKPKTLETLRTTAASNSKDDQRRGSSCDTNPVSHRVLRDRTCHMDFASE